MSAANFAAFFAFVESPQWDGQPLHRTAGDPGGATSWGWTYRTWRGYAELHGLDGSFEHFSQMKRDDFLLPTRRTFWDGIHADNLPSGIDLFWADFQYGSYWATRELQGVLGVDQDNRVGEQTEDAAWAYPDRSELLDRMLSTRKSYYLTLGLPQFIHGWNRRADACAEEARKLLESK